MNEIRQKNDRKNGGFSLVELIVVMAIVAVVGIAILGFFAFCSNQYHNTHSEVTVQTKTQIVQNQIDNFMLNTNRAIAWKNTEKELWLIGEEESGGTFFAACVSYDSGNKSMSYQKYGTCTKIAPGEYEISNGKGKQPLVDGVEDFFVEIPANIQQNGKLKVKLKLQDKKRSFETTFEVMSRNPIEQASSVTVN